ncbi:MAG: sulfatase-like hydrolase/transferase [Lachnospiraceae bacterium]|nr:sulfatase-like hydrolase/transferase [Lachnospiraceae bacterium]
MPKIRTGEEEASETIDSGSVLPVRNSEKIIKKICLAGRWTAAVAVLCLLGWYCAHPDYYGGQGFQALFTSGRTYFMILFSTVLIAAALLPNRLSERDNRIFGWVWFLLSPFAVYFSLLYLNAVKFSIHFTQLNKIAVFFTFWFLYLVVFFLLVLTGSLRLPVILTSVAVAVLGIANCFVIGFRGMALSAGDLFSLRTALTVASSYEYEIDWYIFAEVFLTLAICIVSCKIRGFKVMHWKIRGVLLCVWLIFSGLFYHICCKTEFLEENDIRSEGFTHQLRYKKYDMLFTTLCTCFYLAVDKPEGYSVEKVREIAEDYVAAEAGTDGKDSGESGYDTPNLVVIMNESFADYANIGQGLSMSEDCMPFIHGLTENTIKGNAYASIFGGNTPNSEYEFLTGNTMGFLPPSSVGFHLFVRGAMPSLASEYKSAGYNTLAMHPYRGTNYRRNIVYPQIGFDTYYARVDFPHPDYIRSYISDQTLVERVIEEYEKNLKTGKPFFSYNVTVQNHGDYLRSNTKNLDDSIQVLTPGVDTTRTQMHTNLIKASDEAFEYLVQYFSEQEEPTVIVMFGDHQANLGDSTYKYLIGEEENLTPEELMEKYKVPFIAWANYDIQEETIEKTSLNYLYSILAERLNLPMTGYQRYLSDLSEEIPVLAAGGYWTKDGEFYELDDQESPYFERVNEYNILEYNHIFGKNSRCLELFSLAE